MFAVEVKAARGWADWLFHWLARPILMLQAVQRLRGWEPLLGVYVPHLDPKAVQRFRHQANLYAPNVWWIVADARGSAVSHLPGGDDEHFQPLQEGAEAREWHRPHIASDARSFESRPRAPRLSFGDLDQWLIKVLLLAPSSANWWGGPRGPITSLLQLAKLAQVSPPLVYRWAAAMEASGYLQRSRRVPSLKSLDPLLSEWCGRYRPNDNEVIPCRPIFAQRVDESYVTEVLDVLHKVNRPAQEYALSGHQACRFYRVRHSAARSIHVYVPEDPSALMEALHLAPDPDPAAPVIFLRAKYPRSVFRAAARVDGIVVCDAIQVYLDLYHLRDRGREQAEFLHESILKPLLRNAAGPRDGV